MKDANELLIQQLCEQIALEEHLCQLIQGQADGINDSQFLDAKALLAGTADTLRRHFDALNKLLDVLEKDGISLTGSGRLTNGGTHLHPETASEALAVSRMLRDDYAALNRVTISNTMLHTAALALKSQDLALAALKHLENIAPFVVQIGELLPDVIARELQAHSDEVDLSIAKEALRNTKRAWGRA
jgi:hypothetical protein